MTVRKNDGSWDKRAWFKGGEAKGLEEGGHTPFSCSFFSLFL
jgi:hypothetical protein